MLAQDSLRNKRMLDIGSGSGLFSLAAKLLGADEVWSFDYDPASVSCTLRLKNKMFPDEESWSICEGSVLDKGFLKQLNQFDIVYSWGVLHHTGNMWEAIDNTLPLVAHNGTLFIAIYNDQGWISRYWKVVKSLYNKNLPLRLLMLLLHVPYLVGLRILVRAVRGQLGLERGMSIWYDAKDWLGGYPFEVAKPEEVIDKVQSKGFSLKKLKTCGGRMGCNEYVFTKDSN